MSYSPEQIKEFEFRQRYEQEQGQQQPQQDPNRRAELEQNVQGLRDRMAQDDEVNAGKSGFSSIPGQLAAGTMNYGRSIINLPNTLSGGKIPAFLDKDYDYYDAMGVNKGITGGVSEGLLEYSPFAAGANLVVQGAKGLSKVPMLAKHAPEFLKKGANAASKLINKAPVPAMLAENVIGGAAYGAAYGDDPLQGAIMGAATGVAGYGAGKAIEKAVVQPLAKAYSQSAIPGLIDNATSIMKGNKSPTHYAQEYKAGYEGAKTAANKEWQQTDTLAKNIDEKLQALPNYKFKPKAYNNYVDDFIASKKGLEPAKRDAYENAIKLAEEFKLKGPKSFGGVVELRKNANEILKKFMEKNNIKSSDAHMKVFLSGIKDSLKKSIPDNAPAWLKPEINQFKNSWEAANQATQNKTKFYKAPSPGAPGVRRPQKSIRESLDQKGELDSSVFQKFAPKNTQEKAPGVAQLSKILGSGQKGADAMRSYLGRGINKNKSAMDIYESLSPYQRNRIFGHSAEGKQLAKADEIKEKFGKSNEDMSLLHYGLGLGAPGLGVMTYDLLTGKGFDKALADATLTAGGLYAIRKGAGKVSSRNPKNLNKAISLAENGVNKPGSAINFMAQPGVPAIWGKGSNQEESK
jgi:hypothetical protein